MIYCIIIPLHWALYVRIYDVVDMHESSIRLFRQTNEFAKNILHTDIINLQASTGVKNLNFVLQ